MTLFANTNAFLQVTIENCAGESLWQRVESFCYRADELHSFLSGLKWGLQHVAIDRSSPRGPTIQGTLPNSLELEGLYRRFRFFILKGEKANYGKLCNALMSATADETAQLFLEYSKTAFLQSLVVDAALGSYETEFSTEEIIDLWFNAVYFHGDGDKIAKLKVFQDLVSSNGAQVALFHAVFDACNDVRNLKWLLKETRRINPRFLVPHYCPVNP